MNCFHFEELKERLDRREWKISFATDDPLKAIEAIRHNEGSVRNQRHHELTCQVALRTRLNDPVATLTPTLVIWRSKPRRHEAYRRTRKNRRSRATTGPSRFIDCLEQSQGAGADQAKLDRSSTDAIR